MVSREDNVVVLLDDIFGETNCIYNREKDTKILDKVHAYVSKGNIKVIITIRDTVKRQCREVFENHRLFKFDFIDLSIDKYILHWEEKDRILKKYMKTVRHSDYVEGAGFVDCNGVTILNLDETFNIISENPVKGFPLAIYQFVYNAKFFQLGSKFFDRPTEAMLEEMNEIRRKGEDHSKLMIQYAVMVYTAINGNYIIPDDVLDREEVEKMIGAIYEKSIRLKQCNISDAITELKGSYLVNTSRENSYKFHHPTLLESVILSFAQIDEKNINKIIPLLSWSFIRKMVTSDSYVAKDGEVVLKISRKSYELLAYRLVDIYLTKISESRTEIYWFLAEIIDTEMFQQNTHKLMTYFLQAFKEESHYNSKRCLKSVEYLRKPIFYELDICDEHMKSKTVFLANLLVTLANTEGQFKVYNCILEKYNQLIKTSNNYLTTKYMKAVLIKSLYEICSTKDVECVKSTLDLVKKEQITILLDQGINFTTLEFQLSHSNTVGYSYNTDNCVFLMFCIWKAYEAFNEPVLKHLLSMYNTIPFDVNLWLKTFYNTNWACWVEGLTSLSYKPLKWMMDRFIVDSDFILKAACQCHMLDTVEYLLSRYETFDAISCLKIFLYEDLDNLDFDKDLFNFLFSKIDITTPEMNNIVVAVLQKQHVPDYVCEAFLPVCINDEAILNLACKEAHIYITKLIIENSHNVNIQPALISVCKEKSTTNYVSDPAQDEVEKLKIFKFIVGKYGYEQFDLKVVCQQAYQNRKFRILEWLVMNIDLNRLDVLCIMNSALVRKSDIILECIIMMTDVKRLDKTEVLGSLIEHYSVSCSTQILEILGIIWDSSEDKKEFKIEKILDMAYEKKCVNLLTWIHENCNSLISIDPKKVILACEDGRTDVAKRILQTFGKTSLDINEGELFMLACDEISNWKYRDRRISMVEWVIETFQMKPLHNKLGLLKLLNNNVFRMESKRHKFFELVVSTLKKCLNYLCKEDKVEIMNKCLAQKYYDVVNWLFENESCCSFDQQTILNKACEDNQIETIKMLNKHFHLLDINEAVISACIGYDLDISVCEYLLKDIDHKSLDTRKIVTTVCKDYVSDNVMKFLLLQFSKDQNTINKVLMSCCHQGNFKFLKHIFRTIHNDQLDILTAFFGACLHPYERTLNSEENLYVIDFLFQKLQDKSNISSDVLNGLLANKRYDIILYFLEQGYCRIIDKSNLLIEACRHGHVKLVQWILQNVDHKELDIKAAFYEACTNCEDMDIKQLHCLSVMWHYIQDINLFEVDTVLKSMTEAPPCKLHVRAYVQDDLRKWLLYIKNINQTNDV